MYKLVFLFLFSLFSSAPFSSVNYEDGFYLTTKCSPGEKPMPVLLAGGQKSVCLPSKPLVDLSGVISITGLVNIPTKNQTAFRIVLSEDAFQKLKRISLQLPANVYAFVFNDEVAFTFEIDVEKFNQIIEVRGNLGSNEIKSLHQQLGKALREGS